MLKYWMSFSKIYDLNNKLRESPVIVVKDYVVVYGVPDEWIEAINLKNKELLLRVEFDLCDDIELGIKKMIMFPENSGFNSLNYWLANVSLGESR